MLVKEENQDCQGHLVQWELQVCWVLVDFLDHRDLQDKEVFLENEEKVDLLGHLVLEVNVVQLDL